MYIQGKLSLLSMSPTTSRRLSNKLRLKSLRDITCNLNGHSQGHQGMCAVDFRAACVCACICVMPLPLLHHCKRGTFQWLPAPGLWNDENMVLGDFVHSSGCQPQDSGMMKSWFWETLFIHGYSCHRPSITYGS